MTTVDAYKKTLLQLKQDTQKSLEMAKDNALPPELDQTAVGRLSRMDSLQQQQMALSNRRRNEAMLHKIDLALARLEKGDYGFCAACDEPINPQRLAVDPTTATCIKCAGGNA